MTESQDPPQQKIFRLHEIEGKLPKVVDRLNDLLRLTNRQWQRRRWLSFTGSLLMLGFTIFCFLRGYYLAFWGSLALTWFSFQLGLSHGQDLEVEVETLMLSRSLLNGLAEIADSNTPCFASVDLLSASKNNPSTLRWLPGYLTTQVVHDHWFTLRVPLWDSYALQIHFSEDVRASTSFGLSSNSIDQRRVGRHYRVELYYDHRCLEESLAKAITSHVGPPNGTTLSSRVEDGCATFLAGVRRLRAEYCESQYSVHLDSMAPPKSSKRRSSLEEKLSIAGLRPFDITGTALTRPESTSDLHRR